MTEFIDLLSRVPFGVAAIAVLMGLACAGLIWLAFESIPPEWDDDEPVWTAERATREHLERLRHDKIRKAHQDLRGHR